jgi:hypothetical protein
MWSINGTGTGRLRNSSAVYPRISRSNNPHQALGRETATLILADERMNPP